MKFLILYSGSPGHFLGVMHFVDHVSIKINVVFASHIGMPDKLQKSYPYVHLTAPPAFLDYEFLHHKDLKQVISLKSDKVYYRNRKQVLEKLIKELRPNVIMLDNHSYTDALIIAELFRDSVIKIVLYQTRLSTALSRNSQYGGVKNGELCFLNSSGIMWKKKLRRWKKRWTMPGLNEDHNIGKLISSLQFDHVAMNRMRNNLDSLTYLPEIILSGIDLSNFQEENQFYTGLNLPNHHTISEQKNNIRIMVSTGSRPYTNPEFNHFLEVLTGLLLQLPHAEFLLPDYLRAKAYDKNVSYYDWNTYQSKLSGTDLHITHGGINSIKDSLSYGAPMLICPLDWRSDQIHNAMMFEKQGLSKTWNIKLDHPETILLKIEELLEDDYRHRILEYVAEDGKRYPVEQVREEFIKLIRDERWEIRNW